MTKYDILEALNNVDDECLKKAKKKNHIFVSF